MDAITQLDTRAWQWFDEHRLPWLNVVLIDVTALGGQTVLTLVTVFAVGLLLALRRYRTAVFVLAAIVSGTLLATLIKDWVERPRPNLELVPPFFRHPTSPSFPSGHSMLSAVIYLTLALVAVAPIAGRRVRAWVLGFTLLLVLLIGFSRMYLGVHYLTDVVAGWTLGLAWALAWRWVEDHWPWVRREREAAPGGGDSV